MRGVSAVRTAQCVSLYANAYGHSNVINGTGRLLQPPERAHTASSSLSLSSSIILQVTFLDPNPWPGWILYLTWGGCGERIASRGGGAHTRKRRRLMKCE